MKTMKQVNLRLEKKLYDKIMSIIKETNRSAGYREIKSAQDFIKRIIAGNI
jgi:hypothetical protein